MEVEIESEIRPDACRGGAHRIVRRVEELNGQKEEEGQMNAD
jgi:hypothetical protein